MKIFFHAQFFIYYLVINDLFVCVSSPAEENPSTPPGGTERSLFPTGGFYLHKKPQLPGGTSIFLFF